MTRSRSFGLGVLALGIACTSTEAPPKAEVPVVEAVEAVRVEPAEIEPVHRLPVSQEPWVWYHAIPAKGVGGLMQVGVSNTAYQRVVGAPRRYVAEHSGGGLEFRREDLTESDRLESVEWSISIPDRDSDSSDAVVMAGLRSTDVMVGRRTHEGYELRRYTQDGQLQWVTKTVDPDPADQTGVLQLGMGRTALIVYNRRELGSYLDEVDLETGQTGARTMVEPSVLSSRFEWPPPKGVGGHRLGHRWPARDGSYVVRKKVEALVVDHAGPDGTRRWSTTVDARGGGWWSSAVLIEQGETVVVVPFHQGSSGAVAYGLSRRDGAVRFEASPGSIGPIGHSKYSNDLALTVDEVGHVLAYGKESGGRYIGVLDIEAGRLLGRGVWRN